jgi:hypothetical protein
MGATFTGTAGAAVTADLAAALEFFWSLVWFGFGLSIGQRQFVKLVVGVKPILDSKMLRFVESKVTAARWF